MQGMPLNVKVSLTQARIREWVNTFGEEGVYISFSGGKDSTVLLHLVRELYPDIPAIFVNTGLEYPEIQAFVRTFDNVTVLTPKMRFNQVIAKYGYPFLGKEIAKNIYYARYGGENNVHYKKLFGLDEFAQSKYATPKYKACVDLDFNIAPHCCDVMKKGPIHSFENQTSRKGITGTTAEESMLRTNQWMRHGCNAFDVRRPVSNPMSFWTEQDILRYIKENNLKIASVYGDVVSTDADGYEYEQTLFDKCTYRTTGCTRTGCIFCGFGAHLEKGEGRFERLKRTHPKQYDYCLGGGEYDPQDGLWKPNKKGLGMAHCIDELCKLYGKDFIKY